MLDFLAIRHDTLEAVKSVMANLMVNYPGIKDHYKMEFRNESIILEFLGKSVSIPFYNTIYGELINKEELKINPMGKRVYDKPTEYKSLTENEIRQKIQDSFKVIGS